MTPPSTPPFRSRADLIPPTAALIAIATGLLVLAGWTWDIDRLKRILPGLVSMNPLTAVAFVLAGLSLWLQRHPPAGGTDSRPSSLGRTAALVVVLTGLLKLATYLTGWDSGLDQILFREKLASDATPFPNRMAPNTALNFLLIGLALAFPNALTRRGDRPAEWLALAVALISLLALIGYAYQVLWLYGVPAFIPMALHTAGLFHLLAIGAVCARPHHGLMGLFTSDSPGGTMVRRLLPGMVLILFVLGWLQLEGERRGLYGTELGVALHSLANIILFGMLIWWSGRSLHRADAARRHEEAERERFFSLSLDLLGIAGMDGYFKRINPAFSRTLGYTTAEILARPFLDFVHPEDQAATLAEVARLREGVPTLNFENRYRCKDGTWKWIAWKGQPFPEEGLLYSTGRDVTEQRRARESIQQLNAELQSQASALEAANQELEAFSYSVSHDLRAPLRHIQGYGEMLGAATEGQLSEKARRYLDTITNASSEMGRLIDDLLAFSRMGRVELHPRAIAMDQLVAESIQGLELSLRDRNITWRIAALPAVMGDPAMVKQVLVNLIGNAVKYTRPRNPAEIEIGVAGREDGRVILFVKDNGAGFEMQYAHKLFGVFQRLHRADEFEGTGIGLAIVRRVVTRHGGRTWAEGAPDRGATFFFTLTPASAAP